MPSREVMKESLAAGLVELPAPEDQCTCTQFSDPCLSPAEFEGCCGTCYIGCTEIVLTCDGKIRRHQHVTAPTWVTE